MYKLHLLAKCLFRYSVVFTLDNLNSSLWTLVTGIGMFWWADHTLAVLLPFSFESWVGFLPDEYLRCYWWFQQERVIKCITSTVFWLSMNLFFLEIPFCKCGVTLSGTPLLSFYFLWNIILKCKVKKDKTTFHLEIRASHETVNGFTSWSVQLSFSPVSHTVLLFSHTWTQPFKKH